MSSFPISIHGEIWSDVQLMAKYLLHYEKLCLTNSLESLVQDDLNELDCNMKHTLSIQTKYYTADLNMSLNVHNDNIIEPSDGCECCILVSSTSEEELHPHISAIGSKAIDRNVDIKLLVILKDQENVDVVEKCRSDRVLWALDNSFEYIEVDKTSPVAGYDVREKEGLPRLMEALHTNMWSAMQRVDHSSKKSVNKEDKSSLPASVFAMPLLPQKTEGAASESTKSSNDETRSDTNECDVGLGYKGLLDAEDDDDKMWNKFNSTIEAAKQLREEALGGNLSDEARRQRAADLALKMCAFMDLDEESSDED